MVKTPALQPAEHLLSDLDTQLQVLLTESRSLYTFLLDPRGFVLLFKQRADAPPPPSRDALASLAVSSFAAAASLSQLFGAETLKRTVHYGDVSLVVDRVHQGALLASVFGTGTTAQRVVYKHEQASAALANTLAAYDDVLRSVKPPYGVAWREHTTELLDTLLAEPQASKP